MKIIAMYLPQFHRLKENDEWWGEGFTEWTAVKTALPLFEGHNQPRVPLGENYYDLLNKDTMRWQTDLMKRYGVFGMCFYHYWFKDGRKILEKPAENLLKWDDIDMPYCFSWANEPWTRTWSKLNEKNVWSSKFEKGMGDDKSSSGILLEQSYGDEEEWKEHFNYLIPFFKDDRYIKMEGKPIFIIHRPLSISCLERMMGYWKRLAQEAGLKGIYFVGVNIAKSNSLDAVLLQEPQYTILKTFNNTSVLYEKEDVERYIDGKKIWEIILRRRGNANERTYFGGFVGYDDTPRRGINGTVIGNFDANDFYNYLLKLLCKNEQCGNDITFINAWNEWGEGMYLEPDTNNKFQYLEAISMAMENYKNIGKCSDEVKKDEDIEKDLLVERYRSYWSLFNNWLTLKEEGRRLETYLVKRGYYEIAIYGIGMMGLHLVKELEGTSVQIKYGIDRRGGNIHQFFPIYRREEQLPEVDVVIVSVTYEYSEIYKYLRRKVNCPIISLGELIEQS